MSKSNFAGLFFLGLWFLLLLAHSWQGPDIWYHLTWGRELVELGRWIPQPPVLLAQPIPANGYWLFQSFIYLLHKFGGIYLVSAIFAALWVAIAVLWLHLSQMWKQPVGWLLFAAFIVCMQLRFEQRPEVFSYLFLLLMTYWAWRGKIAPLFLVQILWVNVHGYFVMGPLVAAALIFHITKNGRKTALVGAGLFAVTLISPFGYHNWENVWNYLQVGGSLRELNHELFMPPLWPIYWPVAVFWLVWLATLALIIRALVRRTEIVTALLALGGVILGGQAIRNMPLLFLLAPLLWRSVSIQLKSRSLIMANSAISVVIGLALSMSVVTGRYHGWVGSLSTFGVHLEWASYPIGAVEFLKKSGFKGKIFADSYDGGFLEFHMEGIQIAGDSYFADADQTKRFFAAIKQPAALLQLHNQINFDVLLINIENTEILEMLFSHPEWVAAYADSHRIVFVKQVTHPMLTGDLTQFSYYQGHNLRRNWTYEFGVVSWMAFAYRLQRPAVMRKILTDLAPAEAVPSAVVQIALKYAVDHKDEEMVRLLAPFKDRVF